MSLPVDLSALQGSQGAEREAALGSLEKQLLCPICVDIFTKPVVILPCQHNLCRKCANELYQPSLFLPRTTMLVNSGRFRCPTCRQEVVLDGHGVYGLRRNLLVENIIDIYKLEISSATATCPAPAAKPPGEVRCAEHQGEKLNIYCLTCQQPTCSLCKVFGSHRLCQVAPLADIHQQQKAELEQELSCLMAKNDQVQAFITELELSWRNDNCKSQKQSVCDQFDAILSVLEKHRKVMTQRITSDEEEKTGHTQWLIRCYGDRVEANSKLLESASRTMEEPDMATFSSEELISKLRAATSSSPPKSFEADGESIPHYRLDFSKQERAIRSINFVREPTQLVQEQQIEQLALSDQTVLKQREKKQAEETRGAGGRVEGFGTPDPIKETQCDQDGMNTQQCEVREHQIDGERGEEETQDVKHRGEDAPEEDNEGGEGCRGGAAWYPDWYAAGGWCQASPGPTEWKDALHRHSGPPQPGASQALSQLMHPEPGNGIQPNSQEVLRVIYSRVSYRVLKKCLIKRQEVLENMILESESGLQASALEATENDRGLLENVQSGNTGCKMDNHIADSGENMMLIQAVILLFYLLAFLVILQRIWAYLGCLVFP
ncbi:hypothetical protein NHX12_010719 [Muraenolepis orangiensis]|uniref:Uncharacterized protein n=1 Tax=Muraenolepis orangiensis TaxID=630683 RepID=A0A9Q0DLX1_9TELE|nr:hypothetical protein NHX12_010719 [Muraenolepis orangiensis]